jgi:Tol biopolymer transport system component
VDDTGSTVAFENWENNRPSVSLSADGRPAETICFDCRISAGWFDGTEGLFLADPAMSSVSLYNLKTRKQTTVLSASGKFLSQATWSPANQMLLFTVSSDNVHHQAFAVPFPRDATQPVGDWIAITDPSSDAILPRWSEDGKTVYYLSDHRNSLCVWARRFDASARKPIGKPFEIQHFQSSRFSVETISRGSLNMSVARNGIYLNIAEISSSVLIGHLQRRGRFSQIFTLF